MIYGISLSNKSLSRHNILYYDLYGSLHNCFRARVSYYPRNPRTRIADSDLRPCWDICHTDMTSRISTCIPMTYNTDAHALKDMVTIFETWSQPLRSDYLHHRRGCPQSHPRYSYARIPKTQGSRPNHLSDYNQRTSQQA